MNKIFSAGSINITVPTLNRSSRLLLMSMPDLSPQPVASAARSLSVYRGIFDWMTQTAPLTQKKVNVPVLGLGGDKSLGVHVAETLQQVATDVRGSAVPNCGHFIAEEQPMYLVDQLRQFFASTR
jgi:pimeloyl-ACP methyl ester carboxylesterase